MAPSFSLPRTLYIATKIFLKLSTLSLNNIYFARRYHLNLLLHCTVNVRVKKGTVLWEGFRHDGINVDLAHMQQIGF